MAKYSYEFKKEIVKRYLEGEGGCKYLAKKYNIGSHTRIREWVKSYKEFGDEGLVRSRQNKNYTFEFKLNVVELYLTSEVSYQELALSVGINNPSLIVKWVNDYRMAGTDGLKPQRKGRKPEVKKLNTEKLNDADKEYLKQLEQENLNLRIENAYLKELRRLRLEEEANLNKRQELSKASEKNSN